MNPTPLDHVTRLYLVYIFLLDTVLVKVAGSCFQLAGKSWLFLRHLFWSLTNPTLLGISKDSSSKPINFCHSLIILHMWLVIAAKIGGYTEYTQAYLLLVATRDDSIPLGMRVADTPSPGIIGLRRTSRVHRKKFNFLNRRSLKKMSACCETYLGLDV